MTDETLSALLDGECSAGELDRLLDRIDKDPSLADQYSRMMLARAARGTPITRHDAGFAARVMDALADTRPDARRVVVPLRRPELQRYWRPLAGLALAAGLGAVAVLALRPVADPVAATTVAVAEPKTVAPAVTEVAERQWDQLAPEDTERLNAYLIAYGQSRAQQGMGSTLGYARFAAHTAEYRPQRIQGPKARATRTRDLQR